jgi:hypothetical protein
MLIYKAMSKHGRSNFVIRPVDCIRCETVTELKNNLDKNEIFYITLLDAKN